MVKFRTKYDERKPVYSCAGDTIKIEYMRKDTKDGPVLVEIGKTDLYGYIQSHADSVDIHKILERCAMINDYGLLDRVPGVYADVVDMPKSLAEAYDQIENAKSFFEKMPVDVKESYDNNFYSFISDIGSDKFVKTVDESLKKMSVKPKNIENIVKEEESNES